MIVGVHGQPAGPPLATGHCGGACVMTLHTNTGHEWPVCVGTQKNGGHVGWFNVGHAPSGHVFPMCVGGGGHAPIGHVFPTCVGGGGHSPGGHV